MNYQAIYQSIVEKAKIRVCDCKTERHHIIPRCMGGTNDSGNLVDLTLREHYIAHQLLCRIYPENQKLWWAAWMMMNRTKRWCSRLYAKTRVNLVVSEATREKIRQANLGKIRSPEAIEKQRNAIKPLAQTEEWKERTRQTHKGRPKPKTDDHRRKLSEANQGKPLSEERRLIIAEQQKGLKQIEKNGHKLRIPPNQIDEYLSKGYTLGWEDNKQRLRTCRLGTTNSKESNESRSKTLMGRPSPTKGKVWITDRTTTKCLPPDEITAYLESGWVLGRIIHGKLRLTKS